MENELVKVETEESLSTEIAKAFVISAAATAGTLAGMVVVAVVAGSIKNRLEARKAKRTQETN